ncbi:MAG: tetratricopeptide repeat protein [Gemmatimonadota bacterium]
MLTILVSLPLAAQDTGSVRDATPRVSQSARTAVRGESAYGESMRELIDRALRTNGTSEYDRVLAYLDSALVRSPNDPVLQHYRGFALYRKASVLVATHGTKGEQGRATKAIFEQADRALERATHGLDWPETLALRSAVTGQLIGFGNIVSAMRLGPRASGELDEALALGPTNPRVWMLRGVGDIYRPRLFGGGLDKAEASLRRALELFATDAPVPPAPWWGHTETYGWLGQVLAKEGKRDEARAAYERALSLQPGNAWVADFLLPALEKTAR